VVVGQQAVLGGGKGGAHGHAGTGQVEQGEAGEPAGHARQYREAGEQEHAQAGHAHATNAVAVVTDGHVGQQAQGQADGGDERQAGQGQVVGVLDVGNEDPEGGAVQLDHGG